jgi:hypothetical protein
LPLAKHLFLLAVPAAVAVAALAHYLLGGKRGR